MTAVDLTDAAVEAIAHRVAELLAEDPRQVSAGNLISAAELAQRLGISVDTVIRRAVEWGGTKVGQQWRFDPAEVVERTAPGGADSSPPPAPPRRRRISAAGNSGVDLLPIRGRR